MPGRHRQCGCDSRDEGTFVQDVGTFNPLCCTSCGATPPPCCYVAHFGCVIQCDSEPFTSRTPAGAVTHPESIDGDVFLRVICEFEDKCVFVSMRAESHADTGFSDGCTWTHRALGYDPSLSVAWQMDISDLSAVTLTYRFGVWANTVVYTCDAEFVCDQANTFTLTTNETGCVQFPNKLCVLPKHARDVWCADRVFESNYPTCPTDVTGSVEQVGDGGYADRADRCACCDPGCDTLPEQPMFITCGACTESTTVTPTVGGGNGLDGVDSPSGQTYGACATLCGKELCANWYCSSGQWKLDGYVDGDFCGTGDLTHECCPLTLGTTTLSGCAPSGCDICVGDGCITCSDCPGAAMPSVISASDGSTTWTLTYDAGLGYWEDTTARDGLGCTGQTAVVQCTGTGIYFALAPSGQSCYATIATCEPLDASCTFTGCDAATYALSITA